MKFKIKPRRKRLENKLKNDFSTKNSNIDNILKYVDEYEEANLDAIDKLKKKKVITSKRISGAIRQFLNAHPTFNKELTGSLTKRILGALIDNTPKPYVSELETYIEKKVRLFMLVFCLMLIEAVIIITMMK